MPFATDYLHEFSKNISDNLVKFYKLRHYSFSNHFRFNTTKQLYSQITSFLKTRPNKRMTQFLPAKESTKSGTRLQCFPFSLRYTGLTASSGSCCGGSYYQLYKRLLTSKERIAANVFTKFFFICHTCNNFINSTLLCCANK